MLPTRNETETCLWNRVDSEFSKYDHLEALTVLADYYEDCGRDLASNYLRVVSDPSNVEDQADLFIDSIQPSFRQLIKMLKEPSARLFACACAEQVSRKDRLFSRAIETTRLFLFGLTSEFELESVRELVWKSWGNKMRETNGDGRRVAWAVARACGVSCRIRSGDVFTDALYAATNSRSYNNNFREVGWTKFQQKKAAVEFLLFDRLIERSTEMRGIIAQLPFDDV